MTTTKTTPKQKSIWSSDEITNLNENYGTDIVVENGTQEEVKATQAPNDAYIVKYVYEDSVRYDLTRGSKVSLFDMYYDKLKQGLKSIEYGRGTIRPSLWGYKSPQGKKKKK